MTALTRLPHWVEYHDGTAYIQTHNFRDYHEAAEWCRATFGPDAVTEGVVAIVPVADPDEERRR